MSKTIENNLSIYEKTIVNQDFGLCLDCNQPKTSFYWCQNCDTKRLQQDFNKWTSGNDFIDKLIQESQLKARNYKDVIEWIPYNNLRNMKYLAQGGFSVVYKAILLGGYLSGWDEEKQQWMRVNSELKDEDYENAKQENIKSPLNENEKYGTHVALKCLNNSSRINEDFLYEWKNYLDFVYSSRNRNTILIKLYGITQDPETLNFMIAMEYMTIGCLRSNLMIKKYNPSNKYINLCNVIQSLSVLHKCNLVHGDFHSGNLLLDSPELLLISDLGLSKPADKPLKSDDIYGVLPYIAPEVLRGEPYTKAADIYSFGIIMWEMSSGIPAFNNISQDFGLSLDICQGLRPEIDEVPNIFDDTEKQKIFEKIEVEYTELMKRCWDFNPNKRPTAEELYINFNEWYREVPKGMRIPGKK
ncbi:Mkk1p [Rhizophagus irregularis DAOM 197198w]|uniref:Mkk1p n=1 Tax=Rhizophagus irregularis (strain DAOM 197198w) TaxID=1432141 RepID=A0A015NA29_RHIIW|nr:Mkk1p [Rhizophagus irregularis DAOM 197198w]